MNSKEILEKIENAINRKVKSFDEQVVNDNSDKDTIKEIAYLGLQLFLNFIKVPFIITAKFLRDEFFKAFKNDAKIFALIMFIVIILFVFFSVLWLFASIAVAVYFIELGNSKFISIIYSIIFQVICFLSISLVAFVAIKKLNSLKMFKKISHYTKL